MTDITSTHLEAALIDQNVAGTFHDKPYAFVAVIDDNAWRLGVAVANEAGYNPIAGKTFAHRAEAKHWADGLNKHIGLSDTQALDIISSTMHGPRVAVL